MPKIWLREMSIMTKIRNREIQVGCNRVSYIRCIANIIKVYRYATHSNARTIVR